MILDERLQTEEPILMVLTHGETLASDITKPLEEAEKKGLRVVRVNVNDQPEFAEEFTVGKHPVVLIYHCGEVLSRRSRPWGHDVGEMISTAKSLAAPASKAAMADADDDDIPHDKPVTVTDNTFMELVMESTIPVVVDFWADWCGPCKMVAPILDKLAKEFAGKVRVAKVDTDANPVLSQQFRIQSIPTMMFVKNGKIVGMNPGAAPEPALRDAFNQLINLKV